MRFRPRPVRPRPRYGPGLINQKVDKTNRIQRKRLSTKVKMKAWAVRNQQEIAQAYESLIQALPKMILNTVEAA